MILKNKLKNSILSNKGFTLIELLVVIAIIGILASVVLASLNSARTKGSDAAVKSNLNNIRAQAALYYDENNTYGASVTCTVFTPSSGTNPSGCAGVFRPGTSGGTREGLIAAASAANSQIYGRTNSNGEAWAVISMLPSGSSYYCVDSAGSSKVVTGTHANMAGWIIASPNVACP